MLEVAQDKMAEYFAKSGGVEKREVSFQAYNLLEDPSPPVPAIGADGVVSTLVLEHVPIPAFFRTTAAILKPGAILLLTNMHSEMGGISQAGFVDPETGVKIRPTSYSHTVKDTLEEAKIAGFELVGELKEARVDEEMAEKLGPRAKKWIGVQVWYGGCFRRK